MGHTHGRLRTRLLFVVITEGWEVEPLAIFVANMLLGEHFECCGDVPIAE